MKNKAFTLVELLVVISIISLLSSIILSNLNSAREKARIASGEQLEANILHGVGDQLIGEWKFDEGSGTALDTSGFGNNGGPVNGAAWISGGGYDGKGAYLVGSGSCSMFGCPFSCHQVCSSGSYINLINPQNLYLGGGDFTISAWVNYSSSAQGGSIFSEGTGNSYAWQQIWFRINNSGNLELNFSGSSGDSVAVVPINKWTFVAVSYVRATSQAILYVNGAADQTVNMGSNLAFTKDQTICAAIGKNCSNGTADFAGLIDNVRIYTTAFSAADIQKQYAEGLESKKDLAVK